ncbi:hypothetical protein R5W24_002291 [Gemmata sp. JC717]|uniref:hypothetical protein n=1 Tax=Gemmata algarum TaxID=2975278 RepID=UPI0021BB08FC|nr:hypothetical protein [Gemmata algarum]MDY3553199.1 hypothetical protein [Gemmata algarum]
MHRLSRRDRVLIAIIMTGGWMAIIALTGAGAYLGGLVGDGRQWQLFGGSLGMGVAVLIISRVFLRESLIETGCLLVLIGLLGAACISAARK